LPSVKSILADIQDLSLYQQEQILSHLNEQICVATVMDRQGNLIIELLCKGRMTHQELGRLNSGRIEDNSILCTDSHKSYMQFAIDMPLDHKKLKVVSIKKVYITYSALMLYTVIEKIDG
jgi:hypothetical protein